MMNERIKMQLINLKSVTIIQFIQKHLLSSLTRASSVEKSSIRLFSWNRFIAFRSILSVLFITSNNGRKRLHFRLFQLRKHNQNPLSLDDLHHNQIRKYVAESVNEILFWVNNDFITTFPNAKVAELLVN